ncbi:hypothetical protein FRC20_010633 [Serendipita sp. 405]|nr:hypothetical protein FRC20_010633 [Serendipita sp. 405]
MLESITLPNIGQLGVDDFSPSLPHLLSSEDVMVVRKERAIERLLEEIEKDIMTEDGPKLQRVVIGDVCCNVAANGRLRRVKSI